MVVDVGYKSEGLVPLNEWEDGEEPPKPGDEIEVLLEGMDDDTGEVVLSRKKAHRMRAWERVTSPSTAKGTSSPARSPARSRAACWSTSASTPSCRPARSTSAGPPDIADYLDREVRCVILSIDEDRPNIVLSRRRLIETERVALRENLMAEIAVGQVRTGTVKNLADFGAFVDLGGVDGLLHITDMGWERLKHPSERLRVDDQIEVMILNVDQERGKIALGLKQLTANPWEQVAEKYAVGASGHRRGRQRDELRRLRQARAGRRRGWSTSPR